jgi:hypothetical protein
MTPRVEYSHKLHNERLRMAAYLTLPARRDNMVEMVETMMTADSLQLTARMRTRLGNDER